MHPGPHRDRLTLAGMAFSGRHGVLPEEQAAAQPFLVSVELVLDTRSAAANDDLSATVDYRGVFDVVRDVVETRSYRLIETLADAVAAEILARFGVEEVEVRVRKPEAPLPGRLDYVEVAIRRGAEAAGVATRSGPASRPG